MKDSLDRMNDSILRRCKRLINSQLNIENHEHEAYIFLFIDLANEYYKIPKTFYSKKIILRSLIDLICTIEQGFEDNEVFHTIIENNNFTTERSRCKISTSSHLDGATVSESIVEYNNSIQDELNSIYPDNSKITRKAQEIKCNKKKLSNIRDVIDTYSRLSAYVHCIPEIFNPDSIDSFDLTMIAHVIIWEFLMMIEDHLVIQEKRWTTREDIIERIDLCIRNELDKFKFK